MRRYKLHGVISAACVVWDTSLPQRSISVSDTDWKTNIEYRKLTDLAILPSNSQKLQGTQHKLLEGSALADTSDTSYT